MIAGAVLAAGSGTRMGQPKAELGFEGVRLLDRAVFALVGGGCDSVVAVVREGTTVRDATPVVNPDPDRGLRSSLQLAVAASDDADLLIVLLADMPDVDSRAVKRVRTGWRPGRVALARYASGTGHPIAMAPALWRDAIELAGPDEGARHFLARHPDLVDEIDAPGERTDLDTLDDVSAWLRNRPGGARSG